MYKILWVVMCNFQLEQAYDKVMMEQFTNRKKGMAYGSFKVQLMILSLFYLSFLEFEKRKGGGGGWEYMIHMLIMIWHLKYFANIKIYNLCSIP